MSEYESAWDWCDVEISDYGSVLSREEMEQYLEENFPNMDSTEFWEHVQNQLDEYYNGDDFDY